LLAFPGLGLALIAQILLPAPGHQVREGVSQGLAPKTGRCGQADRERDRVRLEAAVPCKVRQRGQPNELERMLTIPRP
jgi:hypothetical protein